MGFFMPDAEHIFVTIALYLTVTSTDRFPAAAEVPIGLTYH